MTKMHAKIPKTRFNELANAEYGALYLLNESKNTKVPSSGKMSSPIGGKCFSILTKNARKRNTNLRKKVSRLQFSRNPKLNIDSTTPQSNWTKIKLSRFHLFIGDIKLLKSLFVTRHEIYILIQLFRGFSASTLRQCVITPISHKFAFSTFEFLISANELKYVAI